MKLVGVQASLSIAIKAWADLKRAEAEIRRLNAYKRLNAAMTSNLQAFSVRAAEARKTLDSVLKVAA